MHQLIYDNALNWMRTLSLNRHPIITILKRITVSNVDLFFIDNDKKIKTCLRYLQHTLLLCEFILPCLSTFHYDIIGFSMIHLLSFLCKAEVRGKMQEQQ